MRNEMELSEQKIWEEEFEALSLQLRKEQAANKAKTEYLVMMSHDIRTPLNVMLGMTSIARKYREDGDRLRACLESIDTAGKYLRNLLDDVLNISQIESGCLALEIKEFSLEEMTGQIAGLLQGMTQERRQHFSVECVNLVHDEVLGDAKRLTQVLVNILSNSVKYGGEGTDIMLRVEELAREESGRGTYRFTVRDNGIGMEEEFLQKIFLPYARNPQTEEKAAGNGLGMSIAKRLVALMEGEIRVSSRINQGTEFVVEIPLWQRSHQDLLEACAATENAPELENVEFAGINALLAEDNEDNAEIYAEMFDTLGISVETVSNGKEAVERFAQSAEHTYDCIFMDVQMPIMDGVEAAKAIRAMEREDARLPIVAMTANVFLDDIRRFQKAGMSDHVGKPGTIENFAAVLAKWFPQKIKTEC